MTKYTYVDNSEYPTVKVVYECEAEDILAADKKYEQAIGEDPRKRRYLGVKIQKSIV